MIVSTLLVYSATIDSPKFENFDIKRNLYLYGLGFLVFFLIMMIDFRLIVKGFIYLYIMGIMLLVAVIFYGIEINGARAWFTIPIINQDFQPGELMKLILIITISALMIKRAGDKLLLWQDIVPIAIIALIPFALVFITNDLGNAIIYLVVLLGMYWIGNIKYKYVIFGTLIFTLFIVSFVYLFKTYHEPIKVFLQEHEKGHWVERLDAFIDPENATDKAKYQVVQSKRAIGSGALIGDGYLRGDSIHKNFVPVAYTDGIFVVVGEEFGFIGAAVLLLLYFLLIYRMIMISIQTMDLSGSYMIVGIVSMFVFQIFENIGSLIGLMPLTGITLPFISYGGSSLMINMACLGIVMSVRVHQEKLSMFQE